MQPKVALNTWQSPCLSLTHVSFHAQHTFFSFSSEAFSCTYAIFCFLLYIYFFNAQDCQFAYVSLHNVDKYLLSIFYIRDTIYALLQQALVVAIIILILYMMKLRLKELSNVPSHVTEAGHGFRWFDSSASTSSFPHCYLLLFDNMFQTLSLQLPRLLHEIWRKGTPRTHRRQAEIPTKGLAFRK